MKQEKGSIRLSASDLIRFMPCAGVVRLSERAQNSLCIAVRLTATALFQASNVFENQASNC